MSRVKNLEQNDDREYAADDDGEYPKPVASPDSERGERRERKQCPGPSKVGALSLESRVGR